MFSIVQASALLCICLAQTVKFTHTSSFHFAVFSIVQAAENITKPKKQLNSNDSATNITWKSSLPVDLAMKQRKLAMCFKNSNYTLGSPLPEDCEMDELALNSFKITEENYPLSLDLVKLPNGINLIIELNFYKTMNVSTLKTTDNANSPKDKKLLETRIENVSDYTILLTKEQGDQEFIILIEGKGLKTIATFENLKRRSASNRWVLSLWITGGLLVLLILKLSMSNRIDESFERQLRQIQNQAYCAYFELLNEVSEQIECSICMGSFKKGDILAITICSHCFHQSCFMEWHNIRSQCAYCRKEQSSYQWLIEEKEIADELIKEKKIGRCHTKEQLYQAMLFSRNKVAWKLKKADYSRLGQSIKNSLG